MLVQIQSLAKLSIWLSSGGDTSYKLTGYRCATQIALPNLSKMHYVQCDSRLRGDDPTLTRWITFVVDDTVADYIAFHEVEFVASMPCPSSVQGDCPGAEGPSIANAFLSGGFQYRCYASLDCINGDYGIQKSYNGRWDMGNFAQAGRPSTDTTYLMNNAMWLDLGPSHAPFAYIRYSTGIHREHIHMRMFHPVCISQCMQQLTRVCAFSSRSHAVFGHLPIIHRCVYIQLQVTTFHGCLSDVSVSAR